MSEPSTAWNQERWSFFTIKHSWSLAYLSIFSTNLQAQSPGAHLVGRRLRHILEPQRQSNLCTAPRYLPRVLATQTIVNNAAFGASDYGRVLGRVPPRTLRLSVALRF